MNVLVSLIIPVYNESQTIAGLLRTIDEQTFQPAEIILVDGGSTDGTVSAIKQLTIDKPAYSVIEAGRAMPGKGRNIGASAATHSWIAFTDAGIELDKYWLENLVKKKLETPEATLIYGNFSPQLNTFFDKCASISYVPPLRPGKIRTKSIASCLLKKEVWKKVGGFPDWRAAEDLIFMENADKIAIVTEAPDAFMYWQLRPTTRSTFKKFTLYSMYNVWAGRQANWHYGVAKHYGLLFIFLLLGIFHSWIWWILIPAWLCARVMKRIYLHRYEFGIKSIFNPAIFFTVFLLTVVIDAATFWGWIKAVVNKSDSGNFSTIQ